MPKKHLNPACQKDLLNAFDQELQKLNPPSTHHLRALRPQQVLQSLSKYSEQTVYTVYQYLVEEGCFDLRSSGYVARAGGPMPDIRKLKTHRIVALTAKGYRMLDELNAPAIFSKFSEAVEFANNGAQLIGAGGSAWAFLQQKAPTLFAFLNK